MEKYKRHRDCGFFDQEQRNREKSKVRARAKHVFGLMEQSMGRMFNRTIGVRRAETVIGLKNLTYNMFRKIQLMPQGVVTCA